MLCAGHDRALGQAYNITNDEPLTQEEFLHAIAQELGVVSPWLHIPYRAAYALAIASEGVALLTHPQQPFVTRHGIATRFTKRAQSWATPHR